MGVLDTVTVAAKEVLQVLGEGYSEGVYEEALAHELRLRRIPYERQRNFEMLYKGYRVGDGRVDLVIKPHWAAQGGEELVIELKAVKAITESHQRQVQVYMLSLNIEQGAVMGFSSDVQVVEVRKPKRSHRAEVVQPRRATRRDVAVLLREAAGEVYRYFGQEFIYREDAKKLFPVALGVELRLKGCEFGTVSRNVLYKGHQVETYLFDFYFRDGSVANTVFYRKPEQVDETVDELKFYSRLFGIQTAHLVAFPEKDFDEVRVVSV